MRRTTLWSTISTGVLAVALLLGVQAAGASPTSHGKSGTTTTIGSSVTTTTLNSAQQYRHALAMYKAQLKAIRNAFQASVKSAQATFHAAIAANPTSAGRASARAALQLALTQAVTTRDAALSALGPAPTKP